MTPPADNPYREAFGLNQRLEGRARPGMHRHLLRPHAKLRQCAVEIEKQRNQRRFPEPMSDHLPARQRTTLFRRHEFTAITRTSPGFRFGTTVRISESSPIRLAAQR